MTILLVEDSPNDVEITKRAFRRARVRNDLRIVRDGEEALDYLLRRGAYTDPEEAPRPDLILLDLNLPKVDGREVLRVIKNDEDLKVIPVIVLTTSERDEDIVKSYELGVNTYIPKPVEFDRFLEVVTSIQDYWVVIARLPQQRTP